MSQPRRRSNRTLAIAYLRVSRDLETQALGADAQRQAIEAWARREGVTIPDDGWYVEEVSGGAALDDRPLLTEAVAAVLERRGGFLAFSTLDRFSRDPLTAALIESALAKGHAEVVFADGSGNGSDPTAEMVRAIRLAVARFERRLIGARITAALRVKQRRGEMTGAAPFGWRSVEGPLRRGRDGKERPVKLLEPDAREQSVISTVVEVTAVMSHRRAVVELAARGVVGRAGRPLTRDAVDKIVQRAAQSDAAE